MWSSVDRIQLNILPRSKTWAYSIESFNNSVSDYWRLYLVGFGLLLTGVKLPIKLFPLCNFKEPPSRVTQHTIIWTRQPTEGLSNQVVSWDHRCAPCCGARRVAAECNVSTLAKYARVELGPTWNFSTYLSIFTDIKLHMQIWRVLLMI